MVTVDDLVISLTIKETGKLGQLQKQLEAIVGKKGEKAPLVGIDPTLKADLVFIKRELALIAPSTIAGRGQVKRQAYHARKILNWVNTQELEEFATRVMPEKLDKQAEMAKELGVELGDLQSTIVERFETVIKATQMIAGELTTGQRWSQDLLLAWEKLQLVGPEMPETERKMLFNAFQKAIKENNALMLQYFQKKGLKAFFEDPKFRGTFTQGFKEVVEKKLKGKLDLEKLLPSDTEQQKTMKDIADKADNTVDFLNKVAKEWDLTQMRGEETIKATEKEILGDPFYQNIAANLFKLVWKGKGGAPLEYSKFFRNVILKNILGDIEGIPLEKYKLDEMFEEMSKIDFTVIGATVKLLRDVGLVESAKRFEERGEPMYLFLEQKNMFTKKDIPELKKYIKTVGKDNITVFGNIVKTNIKSTFPDLITDVIDTWGVAYAEKLIVPPLKEKLEELSKDWDKQKEVLEEYIKTLFAGELKIVDLEKLKRLNLAEEFEGSKEKYKSIKEKVNLLAGLFGIKQPTELTEEKLLTKEDLKFTSELGGKPIDEMFLEGISTREEIIKKLDELLAKGGLSDKIIEDIHKFKKSLGVNPNSIDLPSFLGNIGKNLFEIGKEVRDVKTQEGFELGRNFLDRARDIFVDIIGDKEDRVKLGRALVKLENLEKKLYEHPEIAGSGDVPIVQQLGNLLKSMWDYKEKFIDTLPEYGKPDQGVTIQDTLDIIAREAKSPMSIDESIERGLEILKHDEVGVIAKLVSDSEVLKDLKGDMSNKELIDWMKSNLGNIKEFMKPNEAKLNLVIEKLKKMAEIFHMKEPERKRLFKDFE